MAKKDYYETLGVSKTASFAEIKSAYRCMAKKCHPDLHPGDTAAELQFKEVNEAYEVLSDDQKRAAYDRFGHAAFDQSAGGFGNGFGGFNFTGGSFSDLFEEVFNGFMGNTRSRSQTEENLRGDDIRYDLEISLKEAFSGVKKKIDVSTFGVCETCHGQGGTGVETCAACGGRGRVRRQNGFFLMETVCPTCGGSGKTIKKPCSSCKGAGRVRQSKTLEVDIPAGVETGVRMRLSGEGEAGLRGGASGDLYLFVTVKESKLFKRQDKNLYCTVPIPMTTAALGGTIEIPTIDGEKEIIKIPAGTQSGYEVRLRGRGMPVLKSTTRGDLFVTVTVEIPTNLNKRQKELLQEFEAEGKNSPKSTDFWDGIKKFFDEWV